MRFIALILLLVLCYGCDNTKKTAPEMGPGSNLRHYSVLLNIQDASGVELLKEIPKDSITGIIDSELYSWNVVSPENVRVIHAENPLYPGLIVITMGEKDHYYLYIGHFSPSKHVPADAITFSITCPYLFGNESAHVITSYWKPKKNSFDNDCYRITLDGKEFPITNEQFDTVAWLILGD